MTDPTADAARPHSERCPSCNSPNPHLHPAVQDGGEVRRCSDGWHLQSTPENTRPQPAPPEGEPDWQDVIGQAYFVLSSADIRLDADELNAELVSLAKHAYRLGLAARPKVEDAALVLWKKQYGAVASDPTLSEDEARTLLTKAYDLLERLAADRDEWKQQHENLVRVRQVDVANLATKIDDLKQELDRRKGDPRTRLHNICEALQEDLDKSPYTREEWEEVDKQTVELQRKLREAEAKLAEREAELAKAQWYIAGQHSDALGPDYVTEEEIIKQSCKSHAARQQQKTHD